MTSPRFKGSFVSMECIKRTSRHPTISTQGSHLGLAAKIACSSTRRRSFSGVPRQFTGELRSLPESERTNIELAGLYLVSVLEVGKGNRPRGLGGSTSQGETRAVQGRNTLLTTTNKQRFSQMMDWSFVGNSQKVREGTCVIHCVPRSLRSQFA